MTKRLDKNRFNHEISEMLDDQHKYYFYIALEKYSELKTFFHFLNKIESQCQIDVSMNGIESQNKLSNMQIQYHACLLPPQNSQHLYVYSSPETRLKEYSFAINVQPLSKFLKTQDTNCQIIMRQKIFCDNRNVKNSKLEILAFNEEDMCDVYEIGLIQKNSVKIQILPINYYYVDCKIRHIQILKNNKIELVSAYNIKLELFNQCETTNQTSKSSTKKSAKTKTTKEKEKEREKEVSYSLTFYKGKGQEFIRTGKGLGQLKNTKLSYSYDQSFDYQNLDVIYKILQLSKEHKCSIPMENSKLHDFVYEFGEKGKMSIKLYIKPLTEIRQNMLKSTIRSQQQNDQSLEQNQSSIQQQTNSSVSKLKESEERQEEIEEEEKKNDEISQRFEGLLNSL